MNWRLARWDRWNLMVRNAGLKWPEMERKVQSGNWNSQAPRNCKPEAGAAFLAFCGIAVEREDCFLGV